MDRAEFKIIPEYTTAVAALESGAIDVVYDLPPEQQDYLKKSHVSRVDSVPSGHWQGIIFNNEFKPFDDPRVRQAFIKLIDKQYFTDIATFGHGLPTVSPIPPTHPYFRKDLLAPADVPGAKKLLEEAGLVKGFPLLMYVPGSTPTLERIATTFRDVAKQVKVTVSLQIVPPDKFFSEMEGKVPFSVDGFFGRATPDLMTYAWYHSKGSWNDTLWHYSNPEVDEALDRARSTADKAEQAKLYERVQEIVAKDGPGCVIYVENFACGVSNKVQNFTSSPLMFVDISNITINA
jgi:peptide/nickel transport system substrate-binding protein